MTLTTQLMHEQLGLFVILEMQGDTRSHKFLLRVRELHGSYITRTPQFDPSDSTHTIHGMAIQRMRLLVPPTIRDLMDDDVYHRYARKNPRLPVNVSHGDPWQIVARRRIEVPGAQWALKLMPSYADAFRRVMTMLDDHQWEDISIMSRRVLFKPPINFTWNTSRFEWCGRCRRPSLFRYAPTHPALRNAIVLTDDEPFRCYYCGMRSAAQPHYRPRMSA